jgi:hypothetical protein
MVNPTKVSLKVTASRQEWTSYAATDDLKDGMKIAAVIFPAPTPGAHCEVGANLSVTLAHGVKVGGTHIRTELRPLLRWIAEEVKDVIGTVSRSA